MATVPVHCLDDNGLRANPRRERRHAGEELVGERKEPDVEKVEPDGAKLDLASLDLDPIRAEGSGKVTAATRSARTST